MMMASMLLSRKQQTLEEAVNAIEKKVSLYTSE